MKKLLISLTILFSIFVGINSVSAEENTLTYDSSSPLEYLTMTNTINLSDSEVTTLMQSVGYSTDLIDKYLLRRNYALNNNKNDKFYFVNPGIANSFYSDRIFINMSYEEINQAWLEISEKLTYGYTDLFLNIQSKYTYDYTYYYFDYGTSVSSNSSAWLSSNSNFASIKYNSNTKVLDNNKISRNYFYETNMKGNISFKKGSFGNVSSIIIDDITYSLNDTLPITLENGYHSLKKIKPTLKYKTGFVSSEAYDVLGKVSVEFSETDTNIYKYKKSQFKLQFGSNDFSKEYIPVFSHYKVFGKRSDTWTELTEERLKFPYGEDEEGNVIYDDRRLVTIDTTYDYSEGMLADASITFEINYSNLVDTSTTNPIYTDWKIEFYFDNTDNGYIYVYDTLNISTWTDTAKFLEDYIFYYFPPGYRYAFISSEEETASGRIYFPMNHYNNEAVRFRGYNYDYSKNMVMTDLSSGISENDNYYMYFDFDINNNDKKCAVLSRKMGNLYTSYEPNYLNNPFSFLNSYYLVFDSEVSYFYAPSGVKVTFSKGPNDVIIIHTPDGVINSDSNDIYDRNDYDISKNEDNFFKLFHEGFKFFINPIINIFSVITQFFEILPLGIQYMFYVAFGFIILLIIYKFLL